MRYSSLLFLGLMSLGSDARASGICGVPRVDCTTGHVEPADKIVIPETGLSLSDNTTANLSTSKHGLCPKAPNDATKCLVGTGVWATCPGGGGATPTGTGWRHVTSGVEDGSASTPSYSDVGADPAGSSAAVANNLTTHEALTTTAHGGLVASSAVGAANGVCPLGATTKIASTYLPPITESLQSLSDVTTGNVSTSTHGYVPKAPNDVTLCLRGDGSWGQYSCTTPNFVTAYSVDFSSLSSQNLLTGGDGTKTIDGKNWSLFRSVHLQTAYLNDGSHAGLYLRANSDNTSIDNLTDSGITVNIGNLSSAVSQSGLAVVDEWWFWAMISTPHAPNASTETANAGFYWGASSQPEQLMMVEQIVYTSSLLYGRTFAQYNNVDTTLGGTAGAVDVVAFRQHGGIMEAYTGSSSGGAFPARTALTFRARSLIGPPITAAGGIMLYSGDGHRAFFSVASGNTSAAADLLVAKILVEYKSP